MEEKITRIITKVAITAFLAGLFCLGMSVNAKADARAYQSMLNQQYQITLATYDNVIAYQQYEAAYAAQLYQQSLAMQQYQQMLQSDSTKREEPGEKHGFCPECGTKRTASQKFCTECGCKLPPLS